MSDIKFDPESLKAIVAKAIFDSLTPEARVNILQQAVESLLKAGSSERYGAPSVLQQAFNDGVRQVAQAMAHEYVSKDESVQAAIRKLIDDATTRAFAEGPVREKLIQTMVDGMVRAFNPRDY